MEEESNDKMKWVCKSTQKVDSKKRRAVDEKEKEQDNNA